MNLPRHIVINEFALMRFKSVKCNGEGVITIGRIANIVSQETRLSLKSIMGKSRKHSLVEKRQVIMYLAREYKLGTLTKIGSFFGKDHSTVIHSITHIKNLIETDYEISNLVNRIKNRL